MGFCLHFKKERCAEGTAEGAVMANHGNGNMSKSNGTRIMKQAFDSYIPYMTDTDRRKERLSRPRFRYLGLGSWRDHESSISDPLSAGETGGFPVAGRHQNVEMLHHRSPAKPQSESPLGSIGKRQFALF